VLVVLFVHYYVAELKRKELEISLAQQSNYLRSMEEIQKKLRIYST
jgi:hypothetical protein